MVSYGLAAASMALFSEISWALLLVSQLVRTQVKEQPQFGTLQMKIIRKLMETCDPLKVSTQM